MSHDALKSILRTLLDRHGGEFAVKNALKEVIKERRGVENRKPIPKKWIEEAFFKQHGICTICDEPMDLDKQKIVGDHIQPLVQGGKHQRYNIQAVHDDPCNRTKSGNDMVRFSKRLQVGKTNLGSSLDTEGKE